MELATRSSRLGASTIDGIIGIVVVLPELLGIAAKLGTGTLASPAPLFFNGGLVLTAALALVWAGITILLVARNGQTIGKRVTGIKVVRKDGSKASLARIFWLRNFINGIPALIATALTIQGLLSVAGIGTTAESTGTAATLAGTLCELYSTADILMIYGKTHQCLHDRIADTIVVKA